jgi:hypothetical protein
MVSALASTRSEPLASRLGGAVAVVASAFVVVSPFDVIDAGELLDFET